MKTGLLQRASLQVLNVGAGEARGLCGFSVPDWYAVRQRIPQKSCTDMVWLSRRQPTHTRIHGDRRTAIAFYVHRARLAVLHLQRRDIS